MICLYQMKMLYGTMGESEFFIMFIIKKLG